MEPSFWSWEKVGKAKRLAEIAESQWSPAFGAGKRREAIGGINWGSESQWSPAFGAGKSGRLDWREARRIVVAMEPSFWSWEKLALGLVVGYFLNVAMEPSFWSWEKIVSSPLPSSGHSRRNGAQLLELGKVFSLGRKGKRSTCRNGAQLLELGKAAADFCMRPR